MNGSAAGCTSPDYLIVGTGLTGAVFARRLTEAGYTVLALESRSHLGGNVHDHLHESGIRVHSYGPHYFRTSSPRIWDFLQRFATFYPYQASVKSHVDGALENWPIASSYIRRTVGSNWQSEFAGTPANLEEAALALMPRPIYERFVKEYNEKQWGVKATQLSPRLCLRFEVRADDDPRLTPNARYQGLPREGYAAMMERMFAGIRVIRNCDYLRHRSAFRPRRMTIYTGPIDRFFDYSLGRLAYRGQRRETWYLENVEWYQETAQVNEPQHARGAHIRTLEWKHLMEPHRLQGIRGTVITRETPTSPRSTDEQAYPFPDAGNQQLYRQYRAMCDGREDVLICGRLGEYRYFDMDQAIGRTMILAERLLAGMPPRAILGAPDDTVC
jgi:UDP-galactopyranose mutase